MRTLLACHFKKASRLGVVKPSSDMCFELLQRDVIDVRLNDGSNASGYLFQPVVICSSSSQKQLHEATIRLSLSDSEGCKFLAIQDAPSNAECVAVHDIGGKVTFSESRYAGKAPSRVLYVGHETSGSASCCMVNDTTVEVHLKAPHGSQVVTHLSGQLLVCIADDQRLSYNMRLSAEAIAVRPPSCVLPLLPCTSKELQREVYALNKEVKIEL